LGYAGDRILKSAESVRLNTPSDPPEEELLVIRPTRFAEHLAVFLFEPPDGHVAQGLDLFPQGR
jgi:hypothetical protein